MDDIRVVLDAAGFERSVVIAPVSTGTMGVLFAASYPARTSSLVLVDTFARIRQAEDHPAGLPDSVVDSLGVSDGLCKEFFTP